MKRFVLKALTFLSLIALSLGALEYRLSNIPNTYSTKRQQFEAGLEEWQVVALGTSHSTYGVRADAYGVPGYNLAYNTQSLYYDDQLLSKYADRLTNLKVVLIPVSYFSLEMTLPKTQEAWRVYFYERYFHIPPETGTNLSSLQRYSAFQLYGRTESVEYILRGFNVDLAAGITPGGNYIYGRDFSALPGDDTHAATRVAEHHKIMYPEQRAVNEEYLRHMIEVTLAHDAVPVLLILPVRGSYAAQIDAERFQQNTTLLSELATQYHIPYYDYFYDTSFSDEYFYDYDHLNVDGMIKFTNVLREDVLQPLLLTDQRQ